MASVDGSDKREDGNNDEKLWQCWEEEKILLKQYIHEANQTKQQEHLEEQTLENEVVWLKEVINSPTTDSALENRSDIMSHSMDTSPLMGGIAEKQSRNMIIVQKELVNLRELHAKAVATYAEKELSLSRRAQDLEVKLAESQVSNSRLELKVAELQGRLKSIVTGMLNRKSKSEMHSLSSTPSVSTPVCDLSTAQFTSSKSKDFLSSVLDEGHISTSPPILVTAQKRQPHPASPPLKKPPAAGCFRSTPKERSASVSRNPNNDGKILNSAVNISARKTDAPSSHKKAEENTMLSDKPADSRGVEIAASSELQALRDELVHVKMAQEQGERSILQLKKALVAEQDDSGELLLTASQEISRLDRLVEELSSKSAVLRGKPSQNSGITHTDHNNETADYRLISSDKANQREHVVEGISSNILFGKDAVDISSRPPAASPQLYANSNRFAPHIFGKNPSSQSVYNTYNNTSSFPATTRPGGWSRAKKVLM